MGFLDAFKNNTPLPEKGEYKGIPYRIDGDEIILKCSNGEEIGFAPDPREHPEVFDKRRAELKPNMLPEQHISDAMRKPAPLSPRQQFELREYPQRFRKQITAGRMRPAREAIMYGIKEDEYNHLCDMADKIMAKFWKNRKPPTLN